LDKCKRYKVVDIYEGIQCIGYADSLIEVNIIYRQQMADTDGECNIVVKERQTDGGYKKIDVDFWE